MKRIFVLLLCSQLTACPISYEVIVRNDSDNGIGFIWNGVASESTKVEAGQMQSVSMAWGTRCLTVVEETHSLNFRLSERLPRGVQTTGRFDSIVGFSLVYDDLKLSFETNDGEIIPLNTVESCEQA